ncbi:hypothetical protein PVL29_026967 [Vitis rotundifolia]|uniref:red chlorophyll catabolite reductase n=1 Tax=Vitis rotundifolia TaxID=103349 RepID=A0AA38YHX6_VITRO|nr:hypothetical protein PVL29_026967 [Vitis rotundifolia]
MAVVTSHFLLPPLCLPSSPSSRTASQYSVSPKRPPIMAASSSSPSLTDPQYGGGRSRFMEFPHVSAPHRDLMVELVSAVEARLDSCLLPCTLPPDVQYYENQSGNAQASLQVRSGHDSSPIDFVLGSWIHCQLPSGGALNITSFSAYLNPSTDAPNFLIELIRSSPTSLVLILDLPPRKDLALDPDYLQTFYEDTKLESRRQLLEKIPESQPYFSSSLYIRCIVSPTAIMTRIETEAGGVERMEEILQSHVGPVAKEVLGIWLDQCAFGEREVGDSEISYLEKRDRLIRSKTIEIDLGSSLPRLFGPETAGRVLEAMRGVFK